jgi:hypothetical protein
MMKLKCVLKVILAGCLLQMVSAQVWSQDRVSTKGEPGSQSRLSRSGGLQEEKLLLAAARSFVRKNSVPEAKFNLKLINRTGNWALVQAMPIPPFQADPANVIMEKIDQGWIGRAIGSYLGDWEESHPELFR